MAYWNDGNRDSKLLPTAADPSGLSITNNPSMLAAERLVAFCGTAGRDNKGQDFRYYFVRQKSQSPLHDYDNIKRNRELFGYLRALTGLDIPGYGGKLEAKWTSPERDQILASTFDYIRSAPNLATGASTDLKENYYYAPVALRSGTNTQIAGAGLGTIGAYQVVPIRIKPSGASQEFGGFGRFPTVTEVSLVFFTREREDPWTGNGGLPARLAITNDAWIDPTKFITASASQNTKLGCFLVFEIFQPVVGSPTASYAYALRFPQLSVKVDGADVGFPGDMINVTTASSGQNIAADNEERAFVGCVSPMINPAFKSPGPTTPWNPTQSRTNYPFYGEVSVSPGKSSFELRAESAALELYALNESDVGTFKIADPVSASRLVRTINMDFSALNGTYPMPVAPRFIQAYTNKAGVEVGHVFAPPLSAPYTPPATEVVESLPGSITTNNLPPGPYYFNYGYVNVGSGAGVNIPPEGGFNTNKVQNWGHRSLQNRIEAGRNWSTTVQYMGSRTRVRTPFDTVISLQLRPDGEVQGDPRMATGLANVPASFFRPVGPDMREEGRAIFFGRQDIESKYDYPAGVAQSPSVHLSMIRQGYGGGVSDVMHGTAYTGRSMSESIFDFPTSLMSGIDSQSADLGSQTAFAVSGRTIEYNSKNGLPRAGSGSGDPLPDFSNGPGNFEDGAIIEKPPEIAFGLTLDGNGGYFGVPYFGSYNYYGDDLYMSPNRQFHSPVQFGSLPSGLQRGQPWQTLLFCPNPLAGKDHRGHGDTSEPPYNSEPPDHAFLDLFWMPVVEPYAISEPFQTSGKINMNSRVSG